MAAAIVLRALLLVGRLSYGPPILQMGDEPDYHTRAVNLLEHGVYSSRLAPPYVPDGFRCPGFPAVLTAIYAVTGPRPVTGMVLVNLLNAGTVGLVMWMVTRLWDRRAGLAAGAILALDVNHALSGAEYLSETVGTIVALLAVWALLAGWRGKPRWLLVSGALWGLAALTRPTFVWVAAPLIVAGAVRYWRDWPQLAKSTGLVLAGMVLALAPWMIRNQRLFGTPSLTLEVGQTMYAYNGAILWARLTGETEEAAQRQLLARLHGRLRTDDQAQGYNDRLMRQEAVKLFLAHPALVARLQVEGMAKFLLASNRTRLTRVLPEGSRWLRLGVVSNALWYLTLLLAAAGMPRLWRTDRAACAFFVLITLYAATLGSMQGQGRFRVPVDPYICILAGFGAIAVVEALRRRRPSGTPAA